MCTTIILDEMKEAYGSVLNILIKERPWDLKQCLIYIKRFWNPVFSLLISQKQCLKAVEDLLMFIQSCSGMVTLFEELYKSIINYVIIVFQI